MSLDVFTDWLYIASDISGIIPVILFSFWSFRIRKYPLLFYETCLVLILYILTIAIKQAGVVVAGYPGFNLYIYHVVGFVELVLIFLFYHRLLHLPKAFIVIFILVATFYLLDSIFIEYFLETINAFGRSVAFAFLLSLTFYYLISIYKSEAIVQLEKSPTFWFNAGFMIYFATSFFTFLFARQFLSMEFSTWFSAGWTLHAFSNIIKDLFLSIGLVTCKKHQPVMSK